MKSIFPVPNLNPSHTPAIEDQSHKFSNLRDGRVDFVLGDGCQELILLFEAMFILMNSAHKLIVTSGIALCFIKEGLFFFPLREDTCL